MNQIRDDCLKAVIKQIGKIGVKITDKPRITVQNIVASGSVDLNLNLNVFSVVPPT